MQKTRLCSSSFSMKDILTGKKVCKINGKTFLTIYIHSRKLITKTKTALHFTRKTFETHIPGSPDWPPVKKIKKQRKIQKIIYWLVDKIKKKRLRLHLWIWTIPASSVEHQTRPVNGNWFYTLFSIFQETRTKIFISYFLRGSLLGGSKEIYSGEKAKRTQDYSLSWSLMSQSDSLMATRKITTRSNNCARA